MTDPTLTEALATPCKRCGGMPKTRAFTCGFHVYCPQCEVLSANFMTEQQAARQWVEMNKEEV